VPEAYLTISQQHLLWGQPVDTYCAWPICAAWLLVSISSWNWQVSV
jgi:hypothetical protein